MSETGTYPNRDPATSRSRRALGLRSPDALGRQQARNPSPRRLDVPRHRTAHLGGRPRLFPFALAILMVCSAVLAGPAFASPTAGKRQDADHVAQRRDQGRALARLVLSPAGASIRAGTSQTYTATGYDAAGHALGDLTAQTSFSIGPEGSCSGASCSGTQRGRHTITGTVRRGNRTISGTAALQVVALPSPVAPPRRSVERPRAPAAPPRRSVEPRHSPIKRPRDPVTPARRQMEPSRRPGEPGRSPVEPPRGPSGSQPLAQLELDPAREFITPGESLT